MNKSKSALRLKNEKLYAAGANISANCMSGKHEFTSGGRCYGGTVFRRTDGTWAHEECECSCHAASGNYTSRGGAR